jgi:hypothetical protein
MNPSGVRRLVTDGEPWPDAREVIDLECVAGFARI